jgi:AbrB family looped-hinge helix DNA binding protein
VYVENTRLTIPKKIREALGIREGENVDVSLNKEKIIVRKNSGDFAMKIFIDTSVIVDMEIAEITGKMNALPYNKWASN